MSSNIETHQGAKHALISETEYHALYQASCQDPETFWAEQAEKYLHWEKRWTRVLSGDFLHQNVQWFPGAELNVCTNCIDRHLPTHANQPALIWEGDDATQSRTLTYRELHTQVCRFANGLKSIGVARSDRVCIYLPMIPEAVIAMLACARIGAIHSVVFAGFSAESLQQRVQDAQCRVIITADGQMRGGNSMPLKAQVDEIIDACSSVDTVIVVKYTGQAVQMGEQDHWYHELMLNQSTNCPAERMKATDPLFILYTSGSTGQPKGILHGQGGYLLFATMTFQFVFNYQPGDVYWCTADIGWITGHSYVVYGPLSSGATILMFAGTPTYPNPSRCWEMIDRHQVNIFYTAPTAIATLRQAGDTYVKKTSRQSLKVLGTVGEPISPKNWLWYYQVVGKERCPIVNTWWQTETGGIMITPLPFASPLMPGSAGWPFFGVELAIVDDHGKKQTGELEGKEAEGKQVNKVKEKQVSVAEEKQTEEVSGHLVITKPWPGQLQSIYGDPERFKKTYFSKFPGMYCSSDGAHRDKEGNYWITGRTDDVINVSGHRLDTAEIESALVAHIAIAEAAVVGFPHDIKGQGIVAFVTPKAGIMGDEALKKELLALVHQKISAIAKPDRIQWADALPKTRSGKIMRRLLRKIASGETDQLDDVSTLANPDVVAHLIRQFLSEGG